MGSIRRRPRVPAVPAPAVAAPATVQGETISKEDSFESLRQVFHARLESERVHFVTLSAALARAEENPVWIFEDLVYRAHRLQGGAAIFEESEVALAASKLESAAVTAAQSRAGNTDEKVWAALEALVNLMGNLDSVRGLAHA
jgi:hypothetical protein